VGCLGERTEHQHQEKARGLARLSVSTFSTQLPSSGMRSASSSPDCIAESSPTVFPRHVFVYPPITEILNVPAPSERFFRPPKGVLDTLRKHADAEWRQESMQKADIAAAPDTIPTSPAVVRPASLTQPRFPNLDLTARYTRPRKTTGPSKSRTRKPVQPVQPPPKDNTRLFDNIIFGNLVRTNNNNDNG
jgi:hypothetical protein